MSALRPFGVVLEDRHVSGLFVRRSAPSDPSPIVPPLLLVHGAYDGWWVWHKWLSFFAGCGFTCYALSLRNHPGSSPLSDREFLRVGLADYVADVITVARWIGVPAVFVGHSMGGMVVQKAAETLQPPALVLVASVGPGQLGRHDDDFPTDRLADYREAFLREETGAALDPEDVRQIHERLVPESPTALNDIRGRTPVDRSRIQCPVLAVRGEREQFPVHRAEAIAEFYGGDYLIVPRARHALMYEGDWMAAAIQVGRWLHRMVTGQTLPPIRHADAGNGTRGEGRGASAVAGLPL
jgi:pimeloyl-ACP methyl ester carboxylesterase